MSMFDYLPNGPQTFKAGEALTANTLVKLGTDAGEVLTAGDGDLALGWVDADAVENATVTVYPLRGRVKLLAGGDTAIGDYVKVGAAGTFVVETDVAVPTAFTLGQSAGVGAAATLTDLMCKSR